MCHALRSKSEKTNRHVFCICVAFVLHACCVGSFVHSEHACRPLVGIGIDQETGAPRRVRRPTSTLDAMLEQFCLGNGLEKRWMPNPGGNLSPDLLRFATGRYKFVLFHCRHFCHDCHVCAENAPLPKPKLLKKNRAMAALWFKQGSVIWLRIMATAAMCSSQHQTSRARMTL